MAECSQSSDGSAETQRNSLLAYILNNAATKLPMKQSEMVEIFSSNKQANKKFQEVLPHITATLKDVYGITLMEVPHQKSGKKFICFGEDTIQCLEELQEDQKREITLLYIVLSFIFLMGGSVYEEQMQKFLEGLQIDYYEEHSYFGPNIKKLILETFVKQLYLKREKSDSELDVDTRYLLSWGFRAKMEFKKKQILEIAARLMDRSPDFFQTQYAEACAEDDENDDDVTVMEQD